MYEIEVGDLVMFEPSIATWAGEYYVTSINNEPEIYTLSKYKDDVGLTDTSLIRKYGLESTLWQNAERGHLRKVEADGVTSLQLFEALGYKSYAVEDGNINGVQAVYKKPWEDWEGIVYTKMISIVEGGYTLGSFLNGKRTNQPVYISIELQEALNLKLKEMGKLK